MTPDRDTIIDLLCDLKSEVDAARLVRELAEIDGTFSDEIERDIRDAQQQVIGAVRALEALGVLVD